MNGEAFEPVRDRRAGGAARLVIGSEHEMVEEELRAPPEEIHERGAAFIGLVEVIVLVESDPGQRLAPPRELVAAPRQLLFFLEQREARLEPFFTGPDLMRAHDCVSPSVLRRA